MISWSLGPLFSEMPLFQRVKEKKFKKRKRIRKKTNKKEKFLKKCKEKESKQKK